MIIPIAEFKSKDKTVTISVEKVDNCYYYLTDRGDRSMRYNNLSQATADIVDLYGKYNGFKLLAGDRT